MTDTTDKCPCVLANNLVQQQRIAWKLSNQQTLQASITDGSVDDIYSWGMARLRRTVRLRLFKLPTINRSLTKQKSPPNWQAFLFC